MHSPLPSGADTAFTRYSSFTCFSGLKPLDIVLLGSTLDEPALGDAARRFGFGVKTAVGLPAPEASFPVPRDPAAHSVGGLTRAGHDRPGFAQRASLERPEAVVTV